MHQVPEWEKEWSAMKVLAVANWMPIHAEATFPIKVAEDLAGKKINGVGGLKPDILREFGATPTSIAVGDVYMAVQKGIIDGGIYGPEPLWSRKWGEFWKYGADYSFGANVFFMVMNKNTWNKLPPDVQQVIDELSGLPLAIKYGEAAMENHDHALELLASELDHEYYQLPEEETAKWFELCRDPAINYMEGWSAKGLPMYKAFDAMMAYMPVKMSLK